MKTLKTILITLLFASFSTVSNADKVGVTITGLDARADGVEVSRGVEQTRSEDLQGVIASFFIEKGFDTPVGPMAVGLDIAPYDIAEVSVLNARADGTNQTADVSISENYGAQVDLLTTIVDLLELEGAYSSIGSNLCCIWSRFPRTFKAFLSSRCP